MTVRRTVLVALASVVLAGTACGGTTSGPGGGTREVREVPPAFSADPANGADLAVTASGGSAVVRSGDATAAVAVPAGAAAEGANWRVTPLSAAPAGVGKPLCPGIYVDTADAEPQQPCAVGFALPGRAPEGATIVRIAEDGSGSVIVPTTRLEGDGMTLLTASVEGFSAYSTSEEDRAAIDKAFVERAKARGKQVDWTIKAGGTETQTNEGWTFVYEFDMFASGADIGQGGRYKGRAMLSVKGDYRGPASIVKTFGKVEGTGRDDALAFEMIDVTLASLLTGESVGPFVSGEGVMRLKGLASLNILAIAPGAKGQYDEQGAQASDSVPFTVLVKGEDVQVEIPGVGIFPGKILRTTR